METGESTRKIPGKNFYHSFPSLSGSGFRVQRVRQVPEGVEREGCGPRGLLVGVPIPLYPEKS